jgi:hypothetical protein
MALFLFAETVLATTDLSAIVASPMADLEG